MNSQRSPSTTLFGTPSNHAMVLRFAELGKLSGLYYTGHPLDVAYRTFINSLDRLRNDPASIEINAETEEDLRKFINAFDRKQFSEQFPQEKQILSYLAWMKNKGAKFIVNLFKDGLFRYADEGGYLSLNALIATEKPQTNPDQLILKLLQSMTNGAQPFVFSPALVPATMFKKLIALFELFQLNISEVRTDTVIREKMNVTKIFKNLSALIRTMQKRSDTTGSEQKQTLEMGHGSLGNLMKLIAENETTLVDICDESDRGEAKAAIQYLATLSRLKMQTKDLKAVYEQMRTQIEFQVTTEEKFQPGKYEGTTYPGYDLIAKKADELYQKNLNKIYQRHEASKGINIYNPADLIKLREYINVKYEDVSDKPASNVDELINLFCKKIDEQNDNFDAMGTFAETSVRWSFAEGVHEVRRASRGDCIYNTIHTYCNKHAFLQFQIDLNREGEQKLIGERKKLESYFQDAERYKKHAGQAIEIALNKKTLYLTELVSVCEHYHIDPKVLFDSVIQSQEEAEKRLSAEFKGNSGSFFAVSAACRALGIDHYKIKGLQEFFLVKTDAIQKSGLEGVDRFDFNGLFASLGISASRSKSDPTKSEAKSFEADTSGELKITIDEKSDGVSYFDLTIQGDSSRRSRITSELPRNVSVEDHFIDHYHWKSWGDSLIIAEASHSSGEGMLVTEFLTFKDIKILLEKLIEKKLFNPGEIIQINAQLSQCETKLAESPNIKRKHSL